MDETVSTREVVFVEEKLHEEAVIISLNVAVWKVLTPNVAEIRVAPGEAETDLNTEFEFSYLGRLVELPACTGQPESPSLPKSL